MYPSQTSQYASPSTYGQSYQNASYPYYSYYNTSGARPFVSPGPIQTAAGPLAQSVPLGPMPNLPSPDRFTPYSYNARLPYGYGYMPQGATGFYNYNNYTTPYASQWAASPYSYSPAAYTPQGTSSTYNYGSRSYMPWAQQPLPPQYPATQNLPQQPPQQASQQGAQPAQPNQAPQQPGANTPQNQASATTAGTDVPQLTPEVVQELNTTLQSSDYNARLEGSKKLAKILDADPDILSKPQYSKYAEALILKVLRDPNSMVRQPLLLSMEVGSLNNPTAGIVTQLTKLKKERGLYNFEPGIVDNILRELRLKQGAQKKPDAQQNTPAAALPGQGAQGQQGDQSSPAAQALTPGQRGANSPMPVQQSPVPGQQYPVSNQRAAMPNQRAQVPYQRPVMPYYPNMPYPYRSPYQNYPYQQYYQQYPYPYSQNYGQWRGNNVASFPNMQQVQQQRRYNAVPM